MTFEFDGQKYRIAFRHDKPREGHYHRTHDLQAMFSWGDVIDERLPVPYLYCATCDEKLIGPRNTHCSLFRWNEGCWVEVGHASGRLNTDAGDLYGREAGRRAAMRTLLMDHQMGLDAPLPGYLRWSKEFRIAAWTAYLKRSQRPEKQDAAV